MRVVLGAAAAVDQLDSDFSDPGLTAVYAGSPGVYTLALPAAPGLLQVMVGVYSPALTIDNVVVTAKAPTLGTMTVKTVKAGVPTDPASADKRSGL
jgi:hypothetical protein